MMMLEQGWLAQENLTPYILNTVRELSAMARL
jgi:hypothetical protein